MGLRIAVVLSGALVCSTMSPARAHADPTCSTLSSFALSGYSCTLGGLIFDSFTYGGLQITPLGTAQRGASGPSSYDLFFNLVGNQVTLTFRPIGGDSLEAFAYNNEADRFNSGGILISALFNYRVIVDPALTNARLLGASALAGRSMVYGSGEEFVAQSEAQAQFSANDGTDGSALGKHYATGDYGTANFSYNQCAPGGSVITEYPLDTGNILCSTWGAGTGPAFFTAGLQALVYVNSFERNGFSFGYVQLDAEWSNTFTTTDMSTVPEPATMTLIGTGLVGLVGVRRRRVR